MLVTAIAEHCSPRRTATYLLGTPDLGRPPDVMLLCPRENTYTMGQRHVTYVVPMLAPPIRRLQWKNPMPRSTALWAAPRHLRRTREIASAHVGHVRLKA